MTAHDPTALVAEWTAAMEGVTPGPWYSEAVETEGSYGSGEDTTEGFDSYVVRTEAQESYGEDAVVCDVLNSGTAEVHEEFGEDGTHAWDEPGRCNAAWIARCSPAGIAPLLALIAQQAATIEAVSSDETFAADSVIDNTAAEIAGLVGPNDEAQAVEAAVKRALIFMRSLANLRLQRAAAALTAAEAERGE